MTITLPIYYTQTFKTKPSKTFLVADNWYRNSHFYLKNKVKTHYHELVLNQTFQMRKLTTFTIHYKLYYKNPSSDPSNIIHCIEKFILDGLQESGVLTNDNVKFHLKGSWEVVGQDKLDPRIEAEISAIP